MTEGRIRDFKYVRLRNQMKRFSSREKRLLRQNEGRYFVKCATGRYRSPGATIQLTSPIVSPNPPSEMQTLSPRRRSEAALAFKVARALTSGRLKVPQTSPILAAQEEYLGRIYAQISSPSQYVVAHRIDPALARLRTITVSAQEAVAQMHPAGQG